jgi:hypothetical protein
MQKTKVWIKLEKDHRGGRATDVQARTIVPFSTLPDGSEDCGIQLQDHASSVWGSAVLLLGLTVFLLVLGAYLFREKELA